jgi:ethanolamine utilization cobalamin adenosyltransferase
MARSRTVEVECDLSEFDTSDLEDELRERGVNPDSTITMDALYEEYSRGNHERTLEMLRVYLMDVTGRVLP